MKQLITPDWIINSIYQIKPQDLIRLGIKGVIVDLDNTLLAWNEYNRSQRMDDWLQEMLNHHIKVFILSNNNPSRVQKALDKLTIPYKARALKPFKISFNQAVATLNLDKKEIVVIGDQLMTDVIGAKLCQLKVILVKPLVDSDIIFTWLNRSLEKLLMKKIGIVRTNDWGDTLETR